MSHIKFDFTDIRNRIKYDQIKDILRQNYYVVICNEFLIYYGVNKQDALKELAKTKERCLFHQVGNESDPHFIG